MIYTLPALPYDFNALEPHIDARTMEIHHGKHHAGYVQRLNEALAKTQALLDEPLEEMLKAPDKLPAQVREAIRNHGGGHYNHSLFWTLLSPRGGGAPPQPLAARLQKSFGGIDEFKDQFGAVALNRFGSGWAWLSMDRSGKLFIHSTPNQDTPLPEGRTPLLGLDVWEHAYYLQYQNRRADYVKAFWNVVNWARVNELAKG